MPLRTGERLGAYEITGPLGKGGMGEVYRGRDTKLDREVAVKVLPEALARDPERLIRFEREAKALAALNHPNIAQIYAVEGSAFIMELVPGETLGERIKRGAVPVDEALSLAGQMAAALDAAHEKGIVHRDFKPGNVMVTPDGVVKVLDFGLVGRAPSAANGNAAVDPEDSPTLTMAATRAGFIMGTAAYMAPEQASGKAVDKRADIWAFGVVLWELLTAKRLFEGETISHVMAAVLTKEPDLELVPQKVRPLLARCLDKDPKRRLRDVGDAMGLVIAAPTDPIETGSRAKRSPSSSWALAAVAVVLAAGVSFLHFSEARPVAESFRFTIPLPKGVDFPGFITLSSDGRFLAGTSNVEGERRLWMRSLTTGEFRSIVAEGGIRSPFWSPDGRFIAYGPQGLKIVPATGGPPQTICSSSSTFGGSWGNAGSILFYDTIQRGIQRVKVDSSGNSDHNCAPFLIPAQNDLYLQPQFLPDGRHFVYLAQSPDEQRQGIYLGNIDDPKDRRKLLPDLSSVIVSPAIESRGPLHLLFFREGKLMAQALNPSALTLSGDPFLVAEGATIGPNANEVEATVAANGLLVYASNTVYSSKATLTWYDRSGRRVRSEGSAAQYAGFFLSPDGKRVGRPIRGSKLMMRDLERGVETVEAPSGWQGVFTPDSRQLVYSIQGGQELLLKDLSLGTQRVLYKGTERVTAASFSQDGRMLFIVRQNPKTKTDIWVLEDPLAENAVLVKERPLLVTDDSESQPILSPDGRWMAYVAESTGAPEIYVKPFPAGPGRWRVSEAGGREPQWSHDGTEIYYVQGSKLMTASVRAAGNEFHAGQPKELFSTHLQSYLPLANLAQYALLPDGRFLVNEREEVAPTLEVMTNWRAPVKQ